LVTVVLSRSAFERLLIVNPFVAGLLRKSALARVSLERFP
jgi:hypothetical protein